VSTQDHNRIVVEIHYLVSGVLILILVTSPWTIGTDHLYRLMIICLSLVLIAALMFSTAIAMKRQVPLGRKLGFLTAAILMLIFWPFGVYSWWFLHTDGARKLYGRISD
jgi:hypothetical protein